MILEQLIEKLIDRCIQLVRHKQMSDQRLYEDFVAPAFDALDAVHAEYLSSFSGYRSLLERLSGEDFELMSVVDVIRRDSLFSANLRTDLGQVSLRHEDKTLEAFVASVMRYLQAGHEIVWDGATNVAREGLIDLLVATWRDLPRGGQRVNTALRHLDEAVGKLQRFHAGVAKERSLLQKDLCR